MKRIVSLALALLLAVGMLGIASAEEKQYDRVTITYTCPQVVAGFDYNAPNGDGYSRWILDKFNIDFQGTNVSWGDWHSSLVTWIKAQDMTDVAIYNFGDTTATEATDIVNQGLLYHLPDDWKERWPGVADVYSKTSLGAVLEELYGGTYFIPRARFYYNLPGIPLANHWCLWMRSDWIKAVGKEVKHSYTIPEVIEICKLIKEQDPGQVGAELSPLCMTSDNAANFFLRANSTYWDTFYKDADGVYQWGAAAPETLEGLKLWYQAYSEGVLDQEYYLLDYEKDMEKFQTLGTAGVSYLGGQTADVENYRFTFKERTGHEYEDFHMANLLGADGYYHQRDLINFWGAVCFKPDIEPAVFERWMDLMEWTCSEDGYPATEMGLKGEDWDRDENGEIISLRDPADPIPLSGGIGEAKYPSLGHVLGSVILWDDLAMDNPNIRKDLRDESKLLYKLRTDESTPETFVETDWNLYMNGTDELRRANSILFANEFSNMVTTATSEENLVEIYNNWIQSQQGLVQPALDSLNGK